MIGKLRSRVTYANVAATLALVLAMSGGAYAATKYVITSTKQIKPSVLKSLKGGSGPSGAAGAPGAPGAKGAGGALGAPGANGSNGSNGTSVTSKEQKTGKLGSCENGGAEFTSASGKTYACNGQTGFTATLPSGSTETGTWSVQSTPEQAEKTESVFTAISFPIPLSKALTGLQVIFVAPGDESHTTECPGDASVPKAVKGDLCVFANELNGLVPFESGAIGDPSAPAGTAGAARSGALLLLTPNSTSPGNGTGAWAVTAE